MHNSMNVKKDRKKKRPIITKRKTEIEPELRPEFIEKIKRREKQKPVKYDF
ncbi:MAG: hypothetical protein PQ975_00455 [Methanobacterium sp.]